MAELENAKRFKEFAQEQHSNAIGKWEEGEARRKGFVSQTAHEVPIEHVRATFVEVDLRGNTDFMSHFCIGVHSGTTNCRCQ